MYILIILSMTYDARTFSMYVIEVLQVYYYSCIMYNDICTSGTALLHHYKSTSASYLSVIWLSDLSIIVYCILLSLLFLSIILILSA